MSLGCSCPSLATPRRLRDSSPSGRVRDRDSETDGDETNPRCERRRLTNEDDREHRPEDRDRRRRNRRGSRAQTTYREGIGGEGKHGEEDTVVAGLQEKFGERNCEDPSMRDQEIHGQVDK